jgi:hypothetical protein
MIIEGIDDNSRVSSGPIDLDPSKKWFVSGEFRLGTFRVTIHLEECLAYRGTSVNEEYPF